MLCASSDFQGELADKTAFSTLKVVITTPEMLVTDDFKELAAIEWEILVVDEAHRKHCAHYIFFIKYPRLTLSYTPRIQV